MENSVVLGSGILSKLQTSQLDQVVASSRIVDYQSQFITDISLSHPLSLSLSVHTNVPNIALGCWRQHFNVAVRDPPTPDSRVRPQKRLVKKSYDKDSGFCGFWVEWWPRLCWHNWYRGEDDIYGGFCKRWLLRWRKDEHKEKGRKETARRKIGRRKKGEKGY